MAEEIVLDSKQVRLLLLYEFRKKNSSARDATKNICDAMAPSTVSYDTAKVWFRKFKNGDFDLTDKPRSGRPVEVDQERLLELIEEDPRCDTRELADELQCHYNTVAVHLRSAGKTCKYGRMDTSRTE